MITLLGFWLFDVCLDQSLTRFGKPYFGTELYPRIMIRYKPLFPLSFWHYNVIYSKNISIPHGLSKKYESVYLFCPLCGPDEYLSRPIGEMVDYVLVGQKRIDYDEEFFQAKNALFDAIKKEISADTLIQRYQTQNGH